MNTKIMTSLIIISVLLVAGCTSTTQSNQGNNQANDQGDTQTNTSTPTIPPTTSPPLPPVSTIAVKEFNMTAKRFEFTPNTITVNRGDRVVLRITSTDVEHGFSLATFDIVETLPAGQTKTIEFTADQAGEFNFFCSVFCGSGHGDMRGKLIVQP